MGTIQKKGSIKKDPAWNYCISIDGKSRNVKCKYCEKILTRGIYRLKHHLACTSKYVGAFLAVPEEVKKLLLGTVSMLQQNLIKKSMFGVDLESNVSDSENFRKRASQEESVG